VKPVRRELRPSGIREPFFGRFAQSRMPAGTVTLSWINPKLQRTSFDCSNQRFRRAGKN
jgi:hypothetical protein